MIKTIERAIPDIYELLSTKDMVEGVDVEEECLRFGEEMAQIMREAMGPEQDRAGRLRLSNIGKPDRQIYNSYNGVSGQDLAGATHIKFLYGHLTEAMLVSLLRLSGHSVTDQQKEVQVEGVKGHIDCFIDGRLVDIKSASGFALKKFKNNTLHNDDPFGYVKQLQAYAYALNQTKFSWLAMDKSSGELALLTYDTEYTDAPYAKLLSEDVAERVRFLKKMVLSAQVPSICYEPVPEGTAGNMRLASGCTYCDYRENCWPDTREFGYAGRHKWLTKIVKEPRVLEIPKEF
tara:strand:+ start:5370 stop:6239 length:870 start_codon:yes stop_codon:yes gene_type:complete